MHKTNVAEFMDKESIDQMLSEMEADVLLNTDPIMVKDDEGSARFISFHERHQTYLQTHPKVNPQNYLANIKTMIRIRDSK